MSNLISQFSLPKPRYNLSGKKINNRKAFKVSTKKKEWNKAAGRDEEDFNTASYCHVCKRRLSWGDRSYEFDHKDNNNSNNSQKNCYLVCRVCHGKATVVKKKKVKDRFTGWTTGHKTIKKKVGYKKQKRKAKKKSSKKKPSNPFSLEIKPIKMPKLRF